jgi:hypothetical protein
MRPKTRLSIRAAVMNGLARCAESETPLSCLANFLEKLAGLGWAADDIATVRNMVLKLLLMSHHKPQSDADDSTMAAG